VDPVGIEPNRLDFLPHRANLCGQEAVVPLQLTLRTMNPRAALTIIALLSTAPPATLTEPVDLEQILAFEGSHSDAPPVGWGGGPPKTLFADDNVVHGGSWSGRIERTSGSPESFSTLTARIPMDFAGTTLELRGFLKTKDVNGWAGLWVREDASSGAVAFDNMQDRSVKGTTGWTAYTIRLPIELAGTKLFFGAFLAGEGTVWVDDLQLLVDGRPIKDAPKGVRTKTVVDTDHEFDAGSKVTMTSLTPAQTANLVTLGKVWGFLKYHHPKVVSGAVHWDYELFRVMPRVLTAPDSAGAQKVILDWVKALGDVPACDPCVSIPDGLAIRADVAWIHDRTVLGEPLSKWLESVYRNRPALDAQAYVAMKPGVGNPDFLREKDYADQPLPDAGVRVLALYRWWNVVQYWSPNRDVIGADWSAVLPEFLPRMVAANDAERYRREMLALISRLNDGHANIGAALSARPPRGDCRVPVALRFVEGKPVVGVTYAETGLKVGDAIQSLDGVPVDRLIEPWKPYYSASNEPARMRGIMRELTEGACGPVQLRVDRSGAPLDLKVQRRPAAETDATVGSTHDLPGAAFRRLSPDVAYLKLSSVKISEIQDYLKGAEGSKGWIVDIRNYPSEFVVFALGGHFVSESTPFVRFTSGDPRNPGAFRWTDPPLAIEPIAPRYAGKVVVLVDEISMSSAEYTGMALRAGPGAIVVGSTTAGADGNVSTVPLPGGLQSWISGIGVFYPDRRPTQRVGIVPDIEARPTIAGIREGRDEVLEIAVRQIVGPSVPELKVREIAKP
jgi:C-terminal processing protease CtpA/Prc